MRNAPNLVTGGIVIFIAGQVATILSASVRGFLDATKMDKRASGSTGVKDWPLARAIGGEYATRAEGVQSLLIAVDTHSASADGREKEWLIATKSRLESLAHEKGWAWLSGRATVAVGRWHRR